MTHQEIVDMLKTNYPGAHWTLNGNIYEGFIWLDEPSTKPTERPVLPIGI